MKDKQYKSQAEAARAWKLSNQTLNAWVQDESFSGDPLHPWHSELMAVEASRKERDKNSVTGPLAGPRREKLEQEIIILKMKIAEMRGELIAQSEHEAVLCRHAQIVNAAHEGIENNLREMGVDEKTRAEVAREIRQAREQIRRDLKTASVEPIK